MAHHNKTPQSVLEAPTVTKTFVEGTETFGPNRDQRRHVTDPKTGKVYNIINPESYSRRLFR